LILLWSWLRRLV